jgi:hypothetical protein
MMEHSAFRRTVGVSARFLVNADELVLDLNLLEKIAALRGDIRVPLSRIVGVAVLKRPLDSQWYRTDVSLGFAARGAPAAKISTIIGARLRSGGKAFLAVHRNGTAVIVDLTPTGTDPWRRLVASVPQPATVVEQIEGARTS